MKKTGRILCIVLCIVMLTPFVAWFGTIWKCNYLTAQYASQFKDFQEIGFDFMHPWDADFDLRVLNYSETKATVYYYADTGGEKAVFIKDNNTWKYQTTEAIWSKQGSADDYIIWPYFKNLVP